MKSKKYNNVEINKIPISKKNPKSKGRNITAFYDHEKGMELFDYNKILETSI